jgi:hypothetical protein
MAYEGISVVKCNFSEFDEAVIDRLLITMTMWVDIYHMKQLLPGQSDAGLSYIYSIFGEQSTSLGFKK